MFQVYVDDSQNFSGRKALFLAGYVNTAEKWVKFSSDWKKALLSEPAIKYFKSTEADRRRGQFDGWAKKDRNGKVMKLALLIEASQPWSLHVSIALDGFDTSFKRKGVPYGFKTPYWIAFETFFVKLLQRHETLGINAPVDFIFDEQNQIERSVTSLFEMLQAAQPEKLHGLIGSIPTFRSDTDIVALQAADMLVWHVRKEVCDGELLVQIPASKHLIKNGKHAFCHIDKSTLEKLSNGMIKIHGTRKLETKANWREHLNIIDRL